MNLFRRPKKEAVITTPSGPREWVQLRSWTKTTGWVPRDVLEGMGVDCSPLDRRDSWDKQGTVWFTAAQGRAIRRHPEWEPEEQ